jgi:hypothetical protein
MYAAQEGWGSIFYAFCVRLAAGRLHYVEVFLVFGWLNEKHVM